MKPLELLKRYALAKQDEGVPGEIREYVTEHCAELAEAFGVTPAALLEACDRVTDDKLSQAILVSVKANQGRSREARAAQRASAAQAAADRLSSLAKYEPGGGYSLDGAAVELLLGECLTRTSDALAFAGPGWEIVVPQGKLYAVRALKRHDLRAAVGTAGLTFRWGEQGRLCFRSRPVRAGEPAPSVCVNLSRVLTSEAA